MLILLSSPISSSHIPLISPIPINTFHPISHPCPTPTHPDMPIPQPLTPLNLQTLQTSECLCRQSPPSDSSPIPKSPSLQTPLSPRTAQSSAP